MTERRNHTRDEDAVSSAPDTEVTEPLTPAAHHISVDHASVDHISVDVQSAGELTKQSPASSSRREAGKALPKGPLPHPAAIEPGKAQGSNTTLQSMRRPEIAPGSVNQTRRFLSIENELADLGLSLRVTQARLSRLEKRLLWALISTGLALLLALLALVM